VRMGAAAGLQGCSRCSRWVIGLAATQQHGVPGQCSMPCSDGRLNRAAGSPPGSYSKGARAPKTTALPRTRQHGGPDLAACVVLAVGPVQVGCAAVVIRMHELVCQRVVDLLLLQGKGRLLQGVLYTSTGETAVEAAASRKVLQQQQPAAVVVPAAGAAMTAAKSSATHNLLLHMLLQVRF